MKRLYLLLLIILFLNVNLYAETNSDTSNNSMKFKFNLSSGYTLSWSTNDTHGMEDIDKNDDFYNGININLSFINYHAEKLILLEPGIKFVTRGLGWYNNESIGYHYIDLNCKFKFNTNFRNELKSFLFYPFVGVVSAIIVNEPKYNSFYDLLSYGLITGVDLILKNKISIGLEYNQLFDRYDCGCGYMNRHSINISIGYLF